MQSVVARVLALLALVVGLTGLMAGLIVAPAAAAVVPAAGSSCGASINEIACENSKPGTPASQWDINGAGDETIQGFATAAAVNVGDSVRFKISTPATNYTIQVFRTGYYGGDGARKIADVTPSATLPQTQPNCLTDASTGLVDCGNWAESASWAVPADAVSGVYVAKLTRTDTGGSSHIIFVVRDDASGSDVVFQTSDTTWQAYNNYGGGSFYGGGTPSGRSFKLSYNRPYATRGTAQGRDFYFASEFAQMQFLEANGYDLSYVSGNDVASKPSILLGHKAYLSVGHDEYWSGSQRANVQAARDAGVNLAFLSGNEIYWRTRWEPAISADATAGRTLVSYKETWGNAKIDPSSEWTGTWRDPRFAQPAQGGGTPENALSGTMYESNSGAFGIRVPADDGQMRLWRNTSVASQAPGDSTTLGTNTLGYEFDEDMDNGFRPAGLVRMSSTTANVAEYMVDYGNRTVPGVAEHHMTLYRAPSGAKVFSAGTIQWSWGLGMPHDGPNEPASKPMQQATVNMLADMNAQPSTLMAGLTPAQASTDNTAPTVAITSPDAGATVKGTDLTIKGTAADTGGRVGGVEVSVDGGKTWHPADGREAWTFKWDVAGDGAVDIRARASDDSGNIGAVVTRGISATCACSLFGSTSPGVISVDDPLSVEVGTQFRSNTNGYVTAIRFYKGFGNDGAHTGHLWSPSGTLMSSVNFVGESARGWQTAKLASPVAITAGQNYTVTYLAPKGNYAATPGYFATPHTDGPLTALGGAYRYGNGGQYPTDASTSNYWVGVEFATDVSALGPIVQSVTPAVDANWVTPATKVSAVLSKDIKAGADIKVVPAGGTAVPGKTTWDSATKTLSFTPTDNLPASARYTATVSGVEDQAGNVMGPYSWSFTTAMDPSAVAQFGDRQPTVASMATDTAAIQVGTQFKSDKDGYIFGVRLYKGPGNDGTHTGRLWSSSGQSLANVTFTGETASGWQTAMFSTPVKVTAGQSYTVSSSAPNGRYAVDTGFFSSPYVADVPLTATGGAYQYGPAGTYPATASTNNYWVGAIFAEHLPDVTAPKVVSKAPADGATDVAKSAKVSAVFDEDIRPGAAIKVTAGSSTVAGSTSWEAATKTLQLTPSAPLAAGKRYTVTVSGVSDLAGNTAADSAWSFTTVADPVPTPTPATPTPTGSPTPTPASPTPTPTAPTPEPSQPIAPTPTPTRTGHPEIPTLPIATTVTVVKAHGKVRIDVNPDMPGTKSRRVNVYRKAHGHWVKVGTYLTRGSHERLTLNARKGRYKVFVLAKPGYEAVTQKS